MKEKVTMKELSQMGKPESILFPTLFPTLSGRTQKVVGLEDKEGWG